MKRFFILNPDSNLKGLAAVAGLFVLAGAISGCGTLNNGGDPYAVASNSALSTTLGLPTNSNNPSLSSSGSGGFNCPALDVNNVVPDYNFNNNGTGFFQVCTEAANPAALLIKGIGATSTNDQICVFPAETSGGGTDYQQTSWVPGTSGLPLYQCGPASLQQGTMLSFPSGTVFNAAFIVDAGQANQMFECLQTDNPANCPQQYSYGEFR